MRDTERARSTLNDIMRQPDAGDGKLAALANFAASVLSFVEFRETNRPWEPWWSDSRGACLGCGATSRADGRYSHRSGCTAILVERAMYRFGRPL